MGDFVELRVRLAQEVGEQTQQRDPAPVLGLQDTPLLVKGEVSLLVEDAQLQQRRAVAVGAALEVADARRAAHRARRIAGLQVHGGDSSCWARWAERRVPYAEMAAHRATALQPEHLHGRPAQPESAGSAARVVYRR